MPADRMEHVPFSGIREIFEECTALEAGGRDIVHLELGRPDFDTPKPIKEAANQAIVDGSVHYTSNYGIESLRDRIAEKFSAENGLAYDPDGEIVVTAGATEAVFTTFMAFADRKTEVLIPDPSWTYAAGLHLANATPVRYPVDPSTGFQPDVDTIQESISAATELLVVNSPHNPTGGVLDSDHALAIRDLAVDNDLLVLSDEIYEKLLYKGEHHSLAALPGMHERTITVNGVSKAYSMTGWRIGYLGAPANLIDPVLRVRQYTTTCAPSISQHAARRAIGSDLHEPMVETFANRRQVVLDRLAEIPGMTVPEPAGAFYVFPAIPDTETDERAFAMALLREAGVALVPGTVFGPSGEGRVRIAYANATDRIEEAFDRLADWVESR